MASLLERLLERSGHTPRAGSTIARLRDQGGVGRSAEWHRIAALPGRDLNLRLVADLSPLWSLGRNGCPGCELCTDAKGEPVEPRLRPLQSAALLEAERHGLFAAVGVGRGKELVTLLLADAVKAERAVILTKPRLRAQLLEVDVPRYGRHFRLPLERIAGVVSYSQLSDADDLEGEERRSVLDRLRPDWVFANEAHCLRNRQSMRARVFWRYMDEHPECRYVPLSGTFADDSISDYSDHCSRALGLGAPVPHGYREVQDWSRALDPPEKGVQPMAPGALLELCGEPPPGDAGDEESLREAARAVYARRFSSTPGVVVSSEPDDCRAQLILNAVRLPIPGVVSEHLGKLRRLWRIGDDDLQEAKDVARYARQLACGFYYRWAWPGGKRDEEWLAARSAWSKVVRHSMRYRRGLYSPLMVERAAVDRQLDARSEETYRDWDAVAGRHRPHPPVEAVWLSDFFLDDVVRWVESCTASAPGIVWFRHAELADRLAARGVRVFRGGDAEGTSILTAREPAIAASINAYKDGQNLQARCRARVTYSPASPTVWQQMLGREHRSGQRAEEVVVDVDMHEQSLESAFATAVRKARFVESNFEPQKILYAKKVGFEGVEASEDVWND